MCIGEVCEEGRESVEMSFNSEAAGDGTVVVAPSGRKT